VLATLRSALEPHGLNLIGATPLEPYDRLVPEEHALRRLDPGAVTAIVIGNGGRALWDALRAHARADPVLGGDPEPVDRFTSSLIEDTAARVLGRDVRRILYPFRFPADAVSFVRLAECAGLGRPSRVGVLIHPVYGPWIALRAAILVPFAVDLPRPVAGFDPCPTCVEQACVTACPGGAVGDAGWDIGRCAAHRRRDDDPCASRCHARFECVIGRAHRYPPDALAYHQARARPALVRWPG